MEYIYLIITILSLVGAILAWIAKLKWSSEFRNAKEAQIESINEQLNLVKEQREQLKEFKSDQIMSLYKSTKEGLEELNNQIIEEKEELANKVKRLETRIEELKEENKNSIKIPDLSELYIISQELDNSINHFSENINIHFTSINKSLENVKIPPFLWDENKIGIYKDNLNNE